MKKHYIGDGVYVKEGENGLWIFTFDGYQEKCHIFLEHDTLASLELLLNTLRGRVGKEVPDER